MKKIIVFLFVGIVFIISCKSNRIKNSRFEKTEIKTLDYIPYYLKVNEADSLYLVDDFEGSYRILDSLFKIYTPLNMDNYVEYGVYLNSAVMSNHNYNISSKVRLGYSRYGGITTFHKQSIEMNMEINKVANLSEEEIKVLKQEYYNSLNLDLRKKMLEMYKEDQRVRIEHKGSTEMDIVDDKNRKELNQIFKTYGFPKKRVIGSNNAFDMPDKGVIYLNIFFMHQPDSVRAKYLPILFDAVKKGLCEPYTYAVVYDRDLILKGEKQYYGTYLSEGGSTYPLMYPKKIDSIRKSIGLPHIKYSDWKVKQFE